MASDPFNFRPDEGRRPRQRRTSGGGALLLALVVGVGAALAVLAFVAGSVALRQTLVGPAPGPAVRADLTRFLADWKANPAGQVEKYRGKAVELRGYVVSVDGAGGAAILRLAPEAAESRQEEPALRDNPGVDVWFWPEHQAGLGRFPVGRKVTVRAVFERVESAPRGLAVEPAR